MNRTEAAILVLLGIEPMSGYDLKAMIDTSLSHFWSASWGSLYPALRKLEARGWVSVAVESRPRGPEARVHSLEPEGKEALQAWLSEPPAGDDVRSELTLRVFAGAHLAPGVLTSHLEGEVRRLRGELARLRSVRTQLERAGAGHPHLRWWLLALDRGTHMTGARLEWTREALARFEGAADAP